MTSRLDPFFSSLFEQLNQQGLSYRTVCGYLLSQGVKISPQSLRSWHLRRSRKIAARLQQAIAPALRAGSTTSPRSLVLASTLQMRGQTTLAPTGYASHASLRAVFTPLQAQIEKEERMLVLQTTGQSLFPVRRKALTDSSEQRIPTTANAQTQKGIPK